MWTVVRRRSLFALFVTGNPPPGEGADQQICLTQTAPQAEQHSLHGPEMQVRLLTQHRTMPTRVSAEAAGFDVYAAHPSEIGPGCRSLVPLNLAFAIPTGFDAQLQPESGLAAKSNTDVSAGVIEYDFRGTIGALLVNNGSEKFVFSQRN